MPREGVRIYRRCQEILFIGVTCIESRDESFRSSSALRFDIVTELGDDETHTAHGGPVGPPVVLKTV